MGNYDDHLRYGAASHAIAIIAAAALFYTDTLSLPLVALVILAAPITVAGAMFPDIDHHASKPYQHFRRSVGYLCGFATAVLVYTYSTVPANFIATVLPGGKPYLLTGVFLIGAACLSTWGSRRILDAIQPPHRGPTHRIPIGIGVTTVFGLTTHVALLSNDISFAIPITICLSGCFFLGFLSHLHCDGMLTQPKTYITVS